uniref:Uncharacterized protein n=1 Tax=Ciona intestinalis TaxID=7719 RepID=H2XLR8_CIOIN
MQYLEILLYVAIMRGEIPLRVIETYGTGTVMGKTSYKQKC